MDYLLGRNAVGISFVTGFGESSPQRPHHRISEADGVSLPVPGMLVGGPQNSSNPDGCTYTSTSKAGKYSDTWCSYSTNEVTINWNAPLAYATNALQYYQNQQLLAVPENEISKRKLILYPNPTKGILHFENNFNDYLNIDIYNVQGGLILQKRIEKNDSKIDMSSLSNGIYFLKTNQDGYNHSSKIIKN
jgi:endoglucanase